MNSILKLLKYLIGWPLSVVSLLFIFKLILSNLQSLTNLKNINLVLLALGVLCFIIYFFLRTYLWSKLIKSAGNKFSFINTSYLWEISEIKRYTPGNIWSFFSRTKLFSENNITKKDVAKSLFDEVVLVILSSFTLSYFYLTSKFNNPLIVLILLAINLIIFLFYIFNKKLKIKLFPKETSENNFKFFVIAILTFFFFGLATYFSAISVFFLDPKNILNFISLFVFALLIGYLSILTPMGLGVREGVTTFGLSSFTSISNAGIISIFTRIIFIVSEIIFLILIYFLSKLKNTIYFKIKIFILTNRYELILFLSALLFFVYFTTAGFLRYDNFFTGRFDLGNMDQTVWNTIHGRIFQATDPNGTAVISRLAFHADFILILISPLYLIWSNPKMLILLQALVLALGSMFVFKIALEALKNKTIALTLSICFLLFPATQYALLYDFHPVTLATTLLLATFYFFVKKKYVYFLIFALLSALTKEQAWSIIAIFGLAIILRDFIKKRSLRSVEFWFGGIVFAISTLVFYELIWKIIPSIRGQEHFALAYFSDFGTSPSSVFINIFLHPIKTISIILNNGSITYLLQLFSPLGFLSFFSIPLLVFALPDLSINILSNNSQLHQIFYQYSSTITPFIFISGIYGARFIIKKLKFISYEKLSIYIIIASLISQFLTGPMPGSSKPSVDMFAKPLLYKAQIESFINKIPTRYKIAATNNLGSHLSRRIDIYTIPNGIDKADVVLFLLNDKYAQPSLQAQKDMAKQMENDPNYRLIFKLNDFVVFAKLSLYAKK